MTVADVNARVLDVLRGYLADRSTTPVIAMVGPAASRPLYPAGTDLVRTLIDEAERTGLMDPAAAATCRELIETRAEAVVEQVRQAVGRRFPPLLRRLLTGAQDEAGRTWTPLQELICRVPFSAAVTVGFDSGLADARLRVRPQLTATGYLTWEDVEELDRWRTGEAFGDDDLPVLYAHGLATRPGGVVLATAEYHRAYAGKLARVLDDLMTRAHLVWVGWDADDRRIAAIRDAVARSAGTSHQPGRAPRHVLLQPWDGGTDLTTLRQAAEHEYEADLLVHPVDGLAGLLGELADPRYPAPSATRPVASPPVTPAPGVRVHWATPLDPVRRFTGRTEELARLHRWAADPQVRLVGVSAWGGAGKTALVTRWVEELAADAAHARPVLGWSFYANPSADDWAAALLRFTGRPLPSSRSGLAGAVLAALRATPVTVVLDGLEVVQQGPGEAFGRFLEPLLQETLAGACRLDHAGLVVLTSRFPFADLEIFDGGPARMLELPALTPTEGSALLAAGGGGWLPDARRRELVSAVDGHALATTVLGELLAVRPPTADLDSLRQELLAAAGTDERVGKVLAFYSEGLSEADRHLLGVISLFGHPIPAEAVLAVAGHPALASVLDGLDVPGVVAAVVRLGGLISAHPDGTYSAHPLVRDTFRPLALGAAEQATTSDLVSIPGEITTRAEGHRVADALELLITAGQWAAADNLYRARTRDGWLWLFLPAAVAGQRAAASFIATEERRARVRQLDTPRMGFYLNEAGMFAIAAGDPTAALGYLTAAAAEAQALGNARNVASAALNLSDCWARLGDLERARAAADPAVVLDHADSVESRDGLQLRGRLADLAGDTATAEEYFTAADRLEHRATTRFHLYSLQGVWWAEFLTRTGRRGPARALTQSNVQISLRQGWNEDAARCHRVLAGLELADGRPNVATAHAVEAVEIFRGGEFLTELAEALPVLACCTLAAGDPAGAHRQATEALDLATPRGLVPARIAALTALASIHAAQGRTDLGRDCAEAGERLARTHQLPWHQLAALEAHPDRARGAEAVALRARLIPPGLDPDPLATVDREVGRGTINRIRRWLRS